MHSLCAEWKSDVENLFQLPQANRPVEPKAKRAISTHRILTSDAIIQQEEKADEKKEHLKEQKVARQKMAKENKRQKLLKLLQQVM